MLIKGKGICKMTSAKIDSSSLIFSLNQSTDKVLKSYQFNLMLIKDIDTCKVYSAKNIIKQLKLYIMKYKLVLILLFMQVAFVSKIKAQFFGVSEGALFTPLSTLDVRGTFGINLFKDTSYTSTSAAAPIILNSAVLYSSLTGWGRTSLQIPAPGSIYLNRVYIIANVPSSSGGKIWDFQNSVFYYDLYNVKTYSVPLNTAVMVICNGTDWLQIN